MKGLSQCPSVHEKFCLRQEMYACASLQCLT